MGRKNHSHNNQATADDIYKYIERFSETIYKNEERRHDSAILQASHMQATFSFLTAALFMLVPILIENACPPLSKTFLLVAFSSIFITLLLSLLFATMAQNRSKRADFPSVAKIHEKMVNNYKSFESPAQRSKYFVETYEKIQSSLATINNKRFAHIQCSMCCFYVALSLCFLWFFIAIIKII